MEVGSHLKNLSYVPVVLWPLIPEIVGYSLPPFFVTIHHVLKVVCA